MEFAIGLAVLAVAAAVGLFVHLGRVLAERNNLAAAHGDVRKRLETEQKEVKRLGDRLATVQREFAEFKEKTARDKKKAEKPDRELNKTRAERAQEENEKLQQRIENLDGKLKAAEDAAAAREKAVADDRKRAEEMTAEVDRLRKLLDGERDRAAKEIADFKAHARTESGRSEAEISAPYQDKIKTLEATIAEFRRSAEKTATERANADREMKRLKILREQDRRVSIVARLEAEKFEDINRELSLQLIEMKKQADANRARKERQRKPQTEGDGAEAKSGNGGEDKPGGDTAQAAAEAPTAAPVEAATAPTDSAPAPAAE